MSQTENGIGQANRVHIVGPPGVGKTTLAHALAELDGYQVVSSGSIVRARLEVGDLRGFSRCQEGGLPDPRRITALVRDAVDEVEIAHSRIIVEGFPRTAAQVRHWRATVSDRTDCVLALDGVHPAGLMSRILNRRVCPDCQQSLAPNESCQKNSCNGEPSRRSDALARIDRVRLSTHRRHEAATLSALRALGVRVQTIDATAPRGTVLTIARRLLGCDSN